MLNDTATADDPRPQRFIRLAPEFTFDARDLKDGPFWLFIRGALWSARHELDYLIPKSDSKDIYSRSDCGSLEEAVSALVRAGFWKDEGDHWRIVYPGVRMTTRARLRKLAKMNSDQQANRSPNRLERAGYAILDKLGLDYERQVMFGGKFTPDALIPSVRLVVQFDGEYWHDRAGTSTHPKIRKQVQLDRAQDAYIRKCGWEVIRFWENDVHQNPERCTQVIRTYLTMVI